jgi:hypothetical protein
VGRSQGRHRTPCRLRATHAPRRHAPQRQSRPDPLRQIEVHDELCLRCR